MSKNELLKTLTVIQGIVTEVTDKKICACCKEAKPYEQFYKRELPRPDYSSYCKECSCEKAREARKQRR